VDAKEGILNFGFWNCAISPPGQSEDPEITMISEAFDLIKGLFLAHNLAFLIICEINEGSFVLLKEMLDKDGFESMLANDKTPTGSRLDLACIYVPTLVSIVKQESHFGNVGTSSIKISQQFELQTPYSKETILLFASHWPSRLQYVADDFKNHCSIGLKYKIERLQEINKQFIIMGDFNDDPYSHALFKNLMATNDRALVISKTSCWLYNPFWKSLSARTFFNKDSNTHDFGTCYTRTNNMNKWSTFDQIIFSGNFLKNGKWFINEEKCTVISDEVLVNLIMDDENKFDHLPIIGSIIHS